MYDGLQSVVCRLSVLVGCRCWLVGCRCWSAVVGRRSVVGLSLVCRWSLVVGLSEWARSEAVAEGPWMSISCRDALGRAATGSFTPTGDQPTTPRRIKDQEAITHGLTAVGHI